MSQKYFLERPMFFRGVSLIVGVLTMSVIISFAVLAAWTDAPANPPGNNVDKPLNIGLNDQIKSGGLSVGAFISKYGTILAKDSGNVGIGTTIPGAKLEVNGSILASGTGDVCNGTGKCLNSVFQTNALVGSNPGCPVGQTMIMKAYNGIWYTADNSSITSWNEITCGAVMSADGTPLLVNNAHTNKSCVDAGGTVVSDGTYNMCRFNQANCPVNWVPYLEWFAVPSVYLQHNTFCGGQLYGCYTSGRAWANSTTNSCCTFSWGCGPAPTLCNTTKSQIGCY